MRRGALAFAVAIAVAAGCNFTQRFEVPAEVVGDDASTGLPGREPCADVESDPNNCGECGHSCQGGSCSRGYCEAVVLAEGLGSSMESDAASEDGPTAIGADTTHAYWLDDRGTTLMRVPVQGGRATRVASLASKTARKLVLTADSVFAGGWSGISRVRKSDGVVTRTIDAPPHLVDFAIYGDTLFYAVRFEEHSEIYRCADLDCTSPPESIYRDSNGYQVGSIEAAGPWLFAGLYSVERSARMEKLHAATGALSIVIGQTASGYGCLRSDGNNIFSSNLRYVIRSPFNPNPDSSVSGDKYIVSGEDIRVECVVPDGDFIYWHEPWGPRRVVRCPKTGCFSPEVLWTSTEGAKDIDWWGKLGARDGAAGLAVSDDAIYFTTADGRVMRLAKPAATKTAPTP